ncbi:Hypothetical protein DIP1569 [Corynebacterium diphtheriae]|uniref:Uncharacterized protein n=1 Tax=Corynebacterium diphtheriae (strain ATCC 700971 / NCTC 13129 / Biotype gravis) TaxID=257309 RepID=Q6NGF6_CORDI|nr:Hypothetical protein DIP1569 [Corynebacterium diphtheriae]
MMRTWWLCERTFRARIYVMARERIPEMTINCARERNSTFTSVPTRTWLSSTISAEYVGRNHAHTTPVPANNKDTITTIAEYHCTE